MTVSSCAKIVKLRVQASHKKKEKFRIYIAMVRSKLVGATPKKVMPYADLMDRLRKTFYYGGGADDSEMEVSGPLAEYAADLFSQPHHGHSLNRLTCVTAGKMHATPCSLIMALIYLDRLNILDPGYTRRITPQELFVLSLMISAKYYAGHDERFYLEDWAKEGNMSEDKLKEMELEFLTTIDWNIYISKEQFFEKLISVERTLAKREGLKRGWLTYSELMQLLPSFTLMKFMLNNIAVLALSYAASVITIAGAFFIASQVPGTILYRKPAANMTAATATTTTSLETPVINTNATQAAPIYEGATGSSTINVGNSKPNESCSALNVEAELLKLEQQYCDEARLNELQQARRLDLDNTRYLPMPHNYREPSHVQQDIAQHWLNIKSEYSDDNSNLLLFQQNAQNVSVFWQLLSDMMQQPFLVRWPEQLWPKLI